MPLPFSPLWRAVMSTCFGSVPLTAAVTGSRVSALIAAATAVATCAGVALGGDADADLLAADVEVQGPGAGDRPAEQDVAGGGGAGADIGERNRPGLGDVVAGLQREEHAVQHRAAAEIAFRLRGVGDDDRHAGGGGAGGELLAEDEDPRRHAEQALNRAGVARSRCTGREPGSSWGFGRTRSPSAYFSSAGGSARATSPLASRRCQKLSASTKAPSAGSGSPSGPRTISPARGADEDAHGSPPRGVGCRDQGAASGPGSITSSRTSASSVGNGGATLPWGSMSQSMWWCR